MTERYSFRAENDSNWKVFIDVFQEYYHVPPLHTHQLGPTPEAQNPEYEFEAAHYQLDGPHRMVSTSGTHKHAWSAKHLYPAEALTRSGNTGPWVAPDLVVIYTGTGDAFNANWGGQHERASFKAPTEWVEEMGWYGRLRHLNLLEIDAIMIAAVNGAVNEVLPKADLMDRAWQIARYLLRFSPIVLRHTRRTFVQEFKRAAVNDLGFGQTMELLGMTQFTPFSGG